MNYIAPQETAASVVTCLTWTCVCVCVHVQ